MKNLKHDLKSPADPQRGGLSCNSDVSDPVVFKPSMNCNEFSRQGMARCGKARHGEARIMNFVVGPGRVWLGKAWFGRVRQGEVRQV
jgi:hypothetical protein